MRLKRAIIISEKSQPGVCGIRKSVSYFEDSEAARKVYGKRFVCMCADDDLYVRDDLYAVACDANNGELWY